jgi:serine/threonine-protein kinase RsbW
MSETKMILTLKHSISELETLRSRLAEFGESTRLSTKQIQHINLVLDELFTNIISYGNTGEAECSIRILLSQDHKILTMEIEDCGIPFNPVEAETPDLESELEDRPIGGMGIHLIKNLMDEIKYERRGDKNVVKLTKRIE